jgi:hypothetical protein
VISIAPAAKPAMRIVVSSLIALVPVLMFLTRNLRGHGPVCQ